MTSIVLFIGGLGGTEAVLILFAFLLLFGAKRIPELARGVGHGLREFRNATRELRSGVESSAKDEHPSN